MAITEEEIKKSQEKWLAYSKKIDEMSPRERMIKKLLAPFGMLLIVLFFSAFLGKGFAPIAFGLLFLIGAVLIYGGVKEKASNFLKIYYIILGILFSTPAVSSMLVHF